MQKSIKPTKKILIARANPASAYSPYLKLATKHNLSIDFKPFVRTIPIAKPEFRRFKSKILSHTALIFNSKTAIDHFFQLTEGIHLKIPDNTKYFCSTEILSHYLQKYIILKKRKVIKAQAGIPGFFSQIKKHKKEKFLIPCSCIKKKRYYRVFKGV